MLGSFTRERAKFCASPRMIPSRKARLDISLFSPAAGQDTQLLDALVFAVGSIRIRIEITDICTFDQCTGSSERIEPFGNRDTKFAQLARFSEPHCRARRFAHLTGGELAQAHQQDPFRFEPVGAMEQHRFAASGRKFAALQDRRSRLA